MPRGGSGGARPGLGCGAGRAAGLPRLSDPPPAAPEAAGRGQALPLSTLRGTCSGSDRPPMAYDASTSGGGACKEMGAALTGIQSNVPDEKDLPRYSELNGPPTPLPRPPTAPGSALSPGATTLRQAWSWTILRPAPAETLGRSH